MKLARPKATHTHVSPIASRPTPGRRRLIVCCDGTWNSPSEERETNVVDLVRAIRPVGTAGDARIDQMVHYHLGVGTGNLVDESSAAASVSDCRAASKPATAFWSIIFKTATRILLFGFSRGAYVVRSVAGMIGVVGLLQKSEMSRFDDAWTYYTLPERDRNIALLDQIAPQSREVDIRCVGVWDTVGALGIPGFSLCSSVFRFHSTGLGPHIRCGLQALAIDERRGNFQPAIWVKSHNDPDQILEQVWFPGVHSNVGGGYLQHGLSDAALLWMASRLREHELLDLDCNVIDAAVERAHAERPVTGRLQEFSHARLAAHRLPHPSARRLDRRKRKEFTSQPSSDRCAQLRATLMERKAASSG